MILTGKKIAEQYKKGHIILKPFAPEHVGTNSYDLSLSSDLLIYEDEVMDPKKAPRYRKITMDEKGYVLQRGDFVLGCSQEVIGSEKYAGTIHARSGIARLGLFVDVTADLIDIGYIGQVTFQLYATLPICLYPGLLIAQITFWKSEGKITLYHGPYQGSQGPRASEMYKEFEGKL